jgi:hypothetical protein
VSYETYYTQELTYGSPNITVPLPEFYNGNFSRLLGPATGQTDALGNSVFRGAIYDSLTFAQMPGGRWTGQMFPGNIIPVSRFSAVSQRLNAIAVRDYLPPVRDSAGQIPLANNAWQATGTPRYPYTPFSGKGDHIFTPKHKLSGSYTHIDQQRWLLDNDARLWSITQPYGGATGETPAANADLVLRPLGRRLDNFASDTESRDLVLQPLCESQPAKSYPGIRCRWRSDFRYQEPVDANQGISGN